MPTKDLVSTVVGLQKRPVAGTPPTTGQVLMFNGTNWVPANLPIGGLPAVGPTPPSPAVQGQLWWDDVSGQLFVYYNDGTSAQWVVANVGIQGQQGVPGPAGPVPLAFSFAGNPSVGFGVGLAIAVPYNVPGNFPGSVGMCTNPGTTTAGTFTVTKLSGTNTFAFGTITFAANSQVPTFSGPGGPLAVGDVLRVLCTATDPNLLNTSMTILVNRA